MMMLDRTTPPAIRPMEGFTLAVPERRSLRNGVLLNVLRMGDEDVVRFDVLMRGGQWCQEQPLQAIFTNRMLREGTRGYTSAQIAERLDFYGAWLDLSSSVNCNIVTLYTLGKYFERSAEILASLLKEPVFPDDELSVVVNTNKRQFLVNAQRVESIARQWMARSLFGEGHPLGYLKEAADYDRITPDALRRFYEAHYHSSNCTLYVSGKVSEDTLRCIERHFGDTPWGREGAAPSVLPVFPIRPATEKRRLIEKPDALQSAVRLGSFTIGQLHPDYARMKVLTTLFGGYFGSRLMSNIREEKGYTYGIAAGMVHYPDAGMVIIGCEAANEYVDPLVREVYHEMDRLCEELVPSDELEMVKNYLMGDLCRTYESAFSVSDAWIMQDTAGLPDDFLERTAAAICTIRPEELQQTARNYLRKENFLEVVAGKKV